MNILILTEYFPETEKSEISGGVEARAFYLAKELSKKNKVFVLTSWRKGLKRYADFGFKVFRIGNHHPYSNNAGFFSRLNFAVSLVKEANKFKHINIIDAYNFTTYLPAYKISKKLKKKVILTYHETWINEWIKNKGLVALPYEFYERLILLLKYDAYISVSNFTKNKLIKNKIPENKIFVVPNGIDFEKIKKINTLNIEKEKNPTICYVGRLVKTKKLDILLKSLSIIKEKIQNIKCKIIGQGPELNNLKNLSIKLQLKQNVDFLGYIKKHEDVLKIMKTTHLFCSASILEGFGIVLLEAISLGLPYVCTDILPFRELTNGKKGFLFQPDNYHEMADKIILLLSNKDIYLKKQHEKFDIEKYKWSNLANQVKEIYKKIL